jgi:hypothetical protein
MATIEKIFSPLVLGATLPNPTLVRLVQVKNKADMYDVTSSGMFDLSARIGSSSFSDNWNSQPVHRDFTQSQYKTHISMKQTHHRTPISSKHLSEPCTTVIGFDRTVCIFCGILRRVFGECPYYFWPWLYLVP